MRNLKSFQEIKTQIWEGFQKIYQNLQPPPRSEMINDLFEGIFHWGPLNGLKIQLWIQELIFLMENLDESNSPRFYILVHGLIDQNEIRNFLNIQIKNLKILDQHKEVAEKYFGNLQTFNFEQVNSQLQVASSTLFKIENEFTYEEKYLLRFLRHGWTHPTLNSYEPKIYFDNKKNKWVDDNKGKHRKLMNSMDIINSDNQEFLNTLAKKLSCYKAELNKLATLSEELTYRFGKYEHKTFETWFGYRNLGE